MNEAGSLVERGTEAVAEALGEMGLPCGEDALRVVRGWFRFYEKWAGRRVVGFDDVLDIAVKLIADSFAVEKVLSCVSRHGEMISAIDLGSGNGWPGLAVKALVPDSGLTLLDSRLGACRFLEAYIREAGIRGVAVIAGRAEAAWRKPEHAGRYSLVTSRAMARPGVALELSAPYCAPRGKVVLWLGPEYEARAGEKTEVPELGLRLEGLERYALPYDLGRRILAVYVREGDMGKGYPRSISSMRAKPVL